MTVGADVLDLLVRRIQDAVPRLPGPGTAEPWRATRLVCVDGPAGSGKSTLASQLAVALSCQVVHMDDLYEGWEAGPGGGARRLDEWVLSPLRQGRAGRYRRYDWIDRAYAEPHRVDRMPFLVVEGCGAGARVVADAASLLVWVEADDDERLRRGLERDGDEMRPHWVQWMADERTHYAAQSTRERADVHLDGVGRLAGSSQRGGA